MLVLLFMLGVSDLIGIGCLLSLLWLCQHCRSVPFEDSVHGISFILMILSHLSIFLLLFDVTFVLQTQAKSSLTLSLREAIKNNDS
jgi:hypothetical protein